LSETSHVAGPHRFERIESGARAFATCRREPGKLIILYVEAPPALRGTGAAGRLMEDVLATARAEGRKVVPVCGYAAAYMRRNAAHRDLLA
jgi:predicted GNAT family acetyltransferase